MELFDNTVYGPVLKTTQLSARAQNHASPERCRKSFTIIFLSDHDFRLTGSNLAIWQHLGQFLAIFSLRMRRNWPFMNFRLKFWHHRSIPWCRFYGGRIFRRYEEVFCLIFALDKLNVRHISTSSLLDRLTKKVCHVMRTSQWQFPPSLKLIRLSVA